MSLSLSEVLQDMPYEDKVELLALLEERERRRKKRQRAEARARRKIRHADKGKRVICGARRKSDGQPCEAKSEPGKRRCRFHGGCSTGPRTEEGKARALANLRNQKSKEQTCR